VIVPTRVGRFLYVTGFTGACSVLAITRSALGDHPAVAAVTDTWAEGVARGIGMQVRTVGGERVDVSRPHVFICNHQSHMDIVALVVGLPVRPGFLAKRELRDVPIFGRAMDAAGHVFVDRSSQRDAFAAIDRAAASVSAGRNLVVFPEGTRSAAGTVKRFKKGGFHLAKKANVPIVPVGVRGTAEVLAKHSKAIRPGTVEVHIGDPLPVAEVALMPVDDLIFEVRRRIAELAAMRLVDDRG
jgi:1-acyl-sn-glycerol-3-phosphate acyltransferase